MKELKSEVDLVLKELGVSPDSRYCVTLVSVEAMRANALQYLSSVKEELTELKNVKPKGFFFKKLRTKWYNKGLDDALLLINKSIVSIKSKRGNF